MKKETVREIRFQIVFALIFIGALILILGIYYNYFTLKNWLDFIFVSMNPEVANSQTNIIFKFPSFLSLVIPTSAIVTAYAALQAAKAYTRQASSAEKDTNRKESLEIKNKFEIAMAQIKDGDEIDVKLGFIDFFEIVTDHPNEYLDNAYAFLIKTIESSFAETVENNHRMNEIIEGNTEIAKLVIELKKLTDAKYQNTGSGTEDFPPYPLEEIMFLRAHIREISKRAYTDESNNIKELYRLKKAFQLIGKIRNNAIIVDAELDLGCAHRLMLSDIQFGRISKLIEIFNMKFTIANANFESFRFENCEFTGVTFENVNFCYKSFDYSGDFEIVINSDYFVEEENLGKFINSICLIKETNTFTNDDPLYFAVTESDTIVWCSNKKQASDYIHNESNRAICYSNKYINDWKQTRRKPNSLPNNSSWKTNLK